MVGCQRPLSDIFEEIFALMRKVDLGLQEVMGQGSELLQNEELVNKEEPRVNLLRAMGTLGRGCGELIGLGLSRKGPESHPATWAGPAKSEESLRPTNIVWWAKDSSWA